MDIVIDITARNKNISTRDSIDKSDMSTKSKLIADATSVAIANHRYFIFLSATLRIKKTTAVIIHETVTDESGIA